VAANRQQGSYLTMFLTGFTGFVAGLVLWAGGEAAAGIIVTVAGAAVLAYSLVGFRKIRPLEFLD